MRRALLVPLAVSTLLTAGAVAPAQAAPQALGDVHLITSHAQTLDHTIRHADGTWQPWGTLTIKSVGPQPVAVASAVINGAEHVIYYGPEKHHPPVVYAYHHLVRDTAGNWTDGSLPDAMPGTPSSTDRQAAANLNGHLALVRQQGDVLALSIQQSDDSWSAWETVPTSGPIGSFSATANGGVLRVVTTNFDGSLVTDHDRAADGAWSQDSTSFYSTATPRVAVAQVGADLHIVAATSFDAPYAVWHTIRHANGSWDVFGAVEAEAGNITAVQQIAVTSSRGALQLVASTTDGGLYHTIRAANGTWQRFGDVKGAAGATSVGDISLAGE
ncbi:hypothetical protein [Kutzneria sp. NPDC052558]|uniref:hypothetical protein n=1 Tax=Kutzneria sp. NPDC052558 TaxID=3364121 RepID=UPI0037C7222D